jgi:L-alanine-DL-glutamate epimerase-like enolase superfamily enzyme
MQPPRSVLKVKVDGGPDLARIAAVRERAPDSALVVDANEAWSERQLSEWLPKLVDLGVLVIEQPLPANDDAALCSLRGVIPFCADESFFDRDSFERVEGRYEIVNIKLDKAGGLTEAWACMKEAEARGLQRMVGCMVSTSLAIAPACLLATGADFVDLDGPLLLERDRTGALHDPSRSLIHHSPHIWGGA